jgi:cardiolipin synthase A/B
MYTTFLVLAIIAIGIQGLMLFLAFFGPDLPYRIKKPPDSPLESDYFLNLLAVLTDAQAHTTNQVEVLTNGNCFYEAQLAAIRSGEHTIHLEAYIFHRGEIGKRFASALAERARAGVKVKLIIDYIGSMSMSRHYFQDLTDAGGRLKWYHSLRPDLLPQINHRTHRELLVVDGKVGFIGGAGIADQWYKGRRKYPRWRDTVVRVEGPVVASLQSAFAQNWLRVAGEILTEDDCYSFSRGEGASIGLVVISTPAAGSTRARVLFQMLIASARKRIYISTPYFLPDRSARQAIIEAVRDRGVEVKILTPGRHSDHVMTLSSSRHLYGSLLKHGAEIYEYEPAMIHVKAMMVDDVWAVVGSTNFDHRSFELNDEINLAILDKAVTKRLIRDFCNDLSQSSQITYDDWRRKSRFRAYEWLDSLLEKQE